MYTQGALWILFLLKQVAAFRPPQKLCQRLLGIQINDSMPFLELAPEYKFQKEKEQHWPNSESLHPTTATNTSPNLSKPSIVTCSRDHLIVLDTKSIHVWKKLATSASKWHVELTHRRERERAPKTRVRYLCLMGEMGYLQSRRICLHGSCQ